jgi:hypothetical protein
MRFLKWLKRTLSPHQEPKRTDLRQTGTHLRQTGKHRSPAPARPANKATPTGPEFVDVDPSISAEIESNSLGKNVPIRNKYVREDTGTHDTLKIFDDSLIEPDEETGIDPYNTGQFDRSKNWDSSFRK